MKVRAKIRMHVKPNTLQLYLIDFMLLLAKAVIFSGKSNKDLERN